MNYSPGNWRVQVWPNAIEVHTMNDPDATKRRLIAKMVMNDQENPSTYRPEREEALANAMVMANAPTMKKALEAILEELEDRYDGAPDSRTKWMAPLIEDALEALRRKP